MKKLLLTLAAFAALVQPAWSQDKWPSRPIKFIVPYAAGGNTDAVTRIAASHLQKSLGVGIVIENRGGAGGIVGADIAAAITQAGHATVDFVIVASGPNGQSQVKRYSGRNLAAIDGFFAYAAANAARNKGLFIG